MKNKIWIEPSILSGDFGALGSEAKRLELAGADAIHVDIMDGLFVPNLTLGARAVGAINRATDLFLDVHLMIYNPYDHIAEFVKMGADRITFHLEATEDVEGTIEAIRRCGVEVGLAIKPGTAVELLLPYLGLCDLILIMTVNPGFGGQEFLPDMVEKIKDLSDIYERLLLEGKIDKKVRLQVDGGINCETGRACVKSGADTIVSGSHLFNAADMAQSIKNLRAACEGGRG